LKNDFNLTTSAYEISVHCYGDYNQRQLERLILLEIGFLLVVKIVRDTQLYHVGKWMVSWR